MQRRNIWITLAVVAAISAGLTAYLNSLGDPQNPPSAPRSARIEYRVTGSAPQVAISYLNDIGIQEQRELPPPWTFGFRARAGRDLTLSVRRVGESGGVGCAIALNGQVVQEVLAEEGRAEASCSAVVPQ